MENYQSDRLSQRAWSPAEGTVGNLRPAQERRRSAFDLHQSRTSHPSRVGRLAVGLAIIAALNACGASANDQPGLGLQVDRNPFRLTILQAGKPVVTEDKGARLRYQLRSDGVQHSLTKVLSVHGNVYRVATNERGRVATVTVARRPSGYRIGVRIEPATNVAQVYDAFEAKPDEHYLGAGERGDAVDLRGQIRPVKVGYQCSYAPIPFFASSAGWGLRLASENVAGFAFPGSTGGGGCRVGDDPQCAFPPLPNRVEACIKGARLDEDIYVGSFAQTLADYEADAGRPRIPPRSELELIKWRDVVNGPGEVLDDVTRFQAAKIPIGWVILDNPWEPCNGLLTFDRSRIPDPAALIRQVHALGVRFMLWVSSKATCSTGYPAGSTLGPRNEPSNQILDFRRPAVVAEFQRRVRNLFALGIDGVKSDRGDENDLEPVNEHLTNEYPLLFARALIGAMPKDAGGIFRAATMGSQQLLPGLWAGDEPGEFIGLQRAIIAGQTASISGFLTWGSDIGGYQSLQLTGEVFARWAQLGAVSPVMSVGGKGPNATPWTFGPAVMDALRDAAVLHYELYPYLYGLLQRRQPVVRPLGYGFPDDPHSWLAPLELLVGPDLLAAPVTGPGATPSVYLPPGRWVDLYTGVNVQGGRAFTRPTPLAEFPFYARSGAVVPFNLRTRSKSWWGLDEQTHPGRAGFLATNGARLDLRDQPRDVQLFVPASSRPRGITLGGRRVPWSWNSGPLPGAVIRLHGPTVRGRLLELESK